MPSPPAAEYTARLAARRAEHARLSAIDARFAAARLAVFGLLVVAALLGLWGALSFWWLLPLVVSFAVLLDRHDRVITRRDAAARAIAFYEHGLARIDDRWIGLGDTGERFVDDAHLYANDLDLFGRGSLFQLLSIARTYAGEETLASWLTTPARPGEIAARQEALAELRDANDLREAVGRAGTDVRAGVHTGQVLAWAEGPVLLAPPILRWVAVALTASVVAALGVAATVGDWTPLYVVLAVQTVFAWPQARQVEHALHSASGVLRDLDVLAHLLEWIEREPFRAPRLAGLRAQLQSGNSPASAAIRALHRLVAIHEWQHNLMFLILSLPFMLGTHLAWAIEAWRLRHGRDIRQWLQACGEFEALASLSAYHYEHPDDPFPDIVEGPARFDGESLGHPLLAAARMVRNDVSLGDTTRLLIVSGSNMSGKSTLLRTVGINAVMALAGAPVRARSLALSPLSVGATLRIQDSLQEGRSRFYAEITRIRQLADVAAKQPPLLFLLDELFHGTNSHDRLIGASGVLRGLLDRGAIGLITTHDLALTAIAGELGPAARNVHFEDWFEGSEMRFDYRMKDGPVTRSNALALMRAVGLDVASPDGTGGAKAAAGNVKGEEWNT